MTTTRENPLGLTPVDPVDLGQEPYACGECAELPPNDHIVQVHKCPATGLVVYRCDQRAEDCPHFRPNF